MFARILILIYFFYSIECRFKSLDDYSKAKNYTFPGTTFYRDYGPRTLDRVRFVHIPKTGTTFAATIVHYTCRNMENVLVDVMIRLNSAVPQPWKIDKTCRDHIILANSRNGNWWTHLPYRHEEDDRTRSVVLLRRPTQRLTSQLIHMQQLMGRMIAFPGIDDQDLLPIIAILKNPMKAFDNPALLPSALKEADREINNRKQKQLVPVSCSDDERDAYTIASYTRMSQAWKICLHDAESHESAQHNPQVFRNRCKWAALAQWPGMQGCMTKMIMGRNCCEKCPVTAADLQEAKRRLTEAFVFVGLQEQWTLTVQAFHASFGGRLYAEELFHTRKSPRSKAVKDNAEAVIGQYINDTADGELYAHGRSLFLARVEELSLKNPDWKALQLPKH